MLGTFDLVLTMLCIKTAMISPKRSAVLYSVLVLVRVLALVMPGQLAPPDKQQTLPFPTG